MAQEITETREAVTQTPTGAVRETTVASDNPDRPNTAERVISLITGILLSLLAIRLVLSLLGANQANAFASFIYSLTYPFVAPFFGLFGYTPHYGVARLEMETLVAMVVYGLIGFGLAKVAGLKRTR